MSKILSAVQKSSGQTLDFTRRLKAMDSGAMFPQLDDNQVREFEQLATTLLKYHDNKGGKTVVFTSTYPEEGTSFVSYHCAQVMAALLDKKVSWIDGNFMNPQRNIKDQHLNLRELLTNPDDVLNLDDDPGLVLIPNGTSPVKAMDLINGPQYPRLLELLQQKFFFNFIDASSVLQGLEVFGLAQHTLGVVLVVQSRKLKYEVIYHGIDKLRENGVQILGTVLNRRTYQLPEFFYKRF